MTTWNKQKRFRENPVQREKGTNLFQMSMTGSQEGHGKVVRGSGHHGGEQSVVVADHWFTLDGQCSTEWLVHIHATKIFFDLHLLRKWNKKIEGEKDY